MKIICMFYVFFWDQISSLVANIRQSESTEN